MNFLTCSDMSVQVRDQHYFSSKTYHLRTQTHVSIASIHDTLGQRLATATLAHRKSLHVFLQIHVQVLEDQVELVAVGVNNVEQAHNVWVIHFFEERDLADGGGRDTLILGLETNLLERDNALVRSAQVDGFVDDTVCACEEWTC